MAMHEYTITDYMSTNIIGQPCHTYELRDHGKVIYSLNNCLNADGSENLQAVSHFHEKAEAIMDARAAGGSAA